MQIDLSRCVNKSKYITNRNPFTNKTNSIIISKSHLELFERFHDNQLIFAIEPISKKKKICSIHFLDVIIKDNKVAYINNNIWKSLELVDKDKLSLKEITKYGVNKLKRSSISSIGDKRFFLPNEVAKSINYYDNSFIGLKIVNNLNGYNVFYQKRELKIVENKFVRFNIKERRLLDIELPTYICEHYISSFADKGLNRVVELYDGSEIIKFDDYYKTKDIFSCVFKDKDIEIFSLYPINDNEFVSLVTKAKKNINRLQVKILQKLIGQNEIKLRSIRPYSTDETENCIRMTYSNMKLIGIEETDTVIISTENKSYKARVFSFDDFNEISKENRLKDREELEYTIGIPAFIRKELGINYINSTVNIKRDLKYLFKKNLWRQDITIVVSILASSYITFTKSLLLKYIISGLLLIIFLYISFSELRQKLDS